MTNQTSPYLEILFFHVYSLYKQCNPKPRAPSYCRCVGYGGSPSPSLVIKTLLLLHQVSVPRWSLGDFAMGITELRRSLGSLGTEEENFALVLFCPWFSSKTEVVQMGVYEQSWFPFRFFNLLAIFNVWATRESPRILEWIAIPFSRGSSGLRDQTWVSCITGRLFTLSHQGSPYYPYFVEKLNLRIILHSFFICFFIFYPSTQR